MSWNSSLVNRPHSETIEYSLKWINLKMLSGLGRFLQIDHDTDQLDGGYRFYDSRDDTKVQFFFRMLTVREDVFREKHGIIVYCASNQFL